jgi:hypothetical protein
MAMEVRLGDRARTTKDLDLAVRLEGEQAQSVRQFLIDCLANDIEEDGFRFLVGEGREMSPDEAGRRGWSFPVEVRLGGGRFASVRVEVIGRVEEISRTERVRLPNVLGFAGFEAREVEAVDPAQHFAEKLHALTRDYGGRLNSRARDLPDLVLLIEEGLQPTSGLRRVVEHVFAQRATHATPTELADPPAEWTDRYTELAKKLDISPKTVDEAMDVVRRFWRETLNSTE